MHVCWPCFFLGGDGLVALSLPCEGSRPRLGGTAEEDLLSFFALQNSSFHVWVGFVWNLFQN